MKKTINIPYDEYLEMGDNKRKLEEKIKELTENGKIVQESIDNLIKEKDVLFLKSRNIVVGREYEPHRYGFYNGGYRDLTISYPVIVDKELVKTDMNKAITELTEKLAKVLLERDKYQDLADSYKSDAEQYKKELATLKEAIRNTSRRVHKRLKHLV